MSKKVTVMRSNHKGWTKDVEIDQDTLELAQAIQVLKSHGVDIGQGVMPSQTTVQTGPPAKVCGIRPGHRFFVTADRKSEISAMLWQYAKANGARRFADARSIHVGRTIWHSYLNGARIVINHLADGEGQVVREK